MNRIAASIAARVQVAKHVAANHNDEGATAVEYGLLVALIAAVIIGSVVTLGGQIDDAFQEIVTQMP
jgi:pilus assembly protein Flp/PilA